MGRYLDIHFIAKSWNSHILWVGKYVNILFKSSSSKKKINKSTPISLRWHLQPQFLIFSVPGHYSVSISLQGYAVGLGHEMLCLYWHFFFLNVGMQYYAKMIWMSFLTNITLPVTSHSRRWVCFPYLTKKKWKYKEVESQPWAYYPTVTANLVPGSINTSRFLQVGSLLFSPQGSLIHHLCCYKPSASSSGNWRAVNLKFKKQ